MKSLSKYKSVKNVKQELAQMGAIKSSTPVKKNNLDMGFFNNMVKKTRLTTIDPEMSRIDLPVLNDLYIQALQTEKPDLWYKIQQGDLPMVPMNILHDLYQLNFHEIRHLSIDSNEFNHKSANLVKKTNDEGMKMITNYSSLNTFIYAKHLMFYFQEKLDKNPPPPGSDNGKQDDGSNEAKEQIAESLANGLGKGSGESQQQSKEMEKVKAAAMQEMKDMLDIQESMEMAEQDGDESDSKGEGQDGGKSAGTGNIQRTKDVLKNKNLFKGIQLNNKELNKMIKHSLDSSVSYFTNKFTEKQISIFESENINELTGIEFIHPALRHLHLEEILTYERKYKMMLDVYIDASGSMSSTYNMMGQRISCWEIAKLMLLKLNSKKIVKDVYPFEYNPHAKMTVKKLMNFKWGGGTSIDNSIQQVLQTKRPSIFITDACDTIRTYSDKVYFIGIGGATLCGPKDIIEKYSKNSQGIEYRQDNTFAPINTRFY